MKLLAGLLLTATCLAESALAQAADTCAGEPAEGFVVAIDGSWHLSALDASPATACSNECELRKGQVVPAGYSLQACPADDTAAHSISIARWNGGVDEISCDAVGSCARPRSLSNISVESEPGLTRFISSVAQLFLSRPPQYATAAARGPQLNEAVIELKEQRIDLAPAFEEAPEGYYDISLSAVSSDPGIVGPSIERNAAWSGRQLVLSVDDLARAVYELTAKSDAGSLNAWVLVVGEPGYADHLGRFADMEQATSHWLEAGIIDSATRRSMLKASLEFLAENDVAR
jgi:hypothetical protein